MMGKKIFSRRQAQGHDPAWNILAHNILA